MFIQTDPISISICIKFKNIKKNMHKLCIIWHFHSPDRICHQVFSHRNPTEYFRNSWFQWRPHFFCTRVFQPSKPNRLGLPSLHGAWTEAYNRMLAFSFFFFFWFFLVPNNTYLHHLNYAIKYELSVFTENKFQFFLFRMK